MLIFANRKRYIVKLNNVTMKKVLLLIVLLAGTMTATAQKEKYDLNGDGKVDVADVTDLVNYIFTPNYKSCPDNKHPHWIDLGLPSGTLWRCCNEGASSPEAFGGYYEFGDVATAPSVDQVKELRNCTTRVWTTRNGVKGLKLTGSNGGSIFLPAAGLRVEEEVSQAGTVGYYWTSIQATGDDAYEWLFYMGDGFSTDHFTILWYEHSVRSVH